MTKQFLGSREFFGFAIFMAALFVLQQNAWAFTAPASSTFAYDVYDIGVNKVLKGPIGFVGGVSAIVLGGVFAVQAKILQAIPAIVGGATILKADSLVSSLGMMF